MDQFICILGSNPYNIGYPGGEVELYIGKEHGKHVITVPSIVHLKPRLIHGPIYYRKATWPKSYLDIYLTAPVTEIIGNRWHV